MKKKQDARAGEFWSINNAKARGHKSIITKRKKADVIEYVSTTHTEKPKHKRKNVRLTQNPQPDDNRIAYVVPYVQKAPINDLGKYHPDMVVKNKTDKSIIRKIKSKNKKR